MAALPLPTPMGLPSSSVYLPHPLGASMAFVSVIVRVLFISTFILSACQEVHRALLRQHSSCIELIEGRTDTARDTDLLTASQKGSHDRNGLWKRDAEMDSNQISIVVSNKLDQKQHLERRMAEDMLEPPLQYRVVDDKEDSDELVDNMEN